MPFGGNQFPKNASNGSGNESMWLESNVGPSYNFAINPPQPGRYDVNVNWNQNYYPVQGQQGMGAFNPFIPLAAPAVEENLTTPAPTQFSNGQVAYYRPPTPYYSHMSSLVSSPFEPSAPGNQAFLESSVSGILDQNQLVASGGPMQMSNVSSTSPQPMLQLEAPPKNKKINKTLKASSASASGPNADK